MFLVAGALNRIVFLLVSDQDFISPVDDLAGVEVLVSEGGQPFVDPGVDVHPIGAGWYYFDFAPLETPVIIRARTTGSAEWRNIHEFMSYPRRFIDALTGVETGIASLMISAQELADRLGRIEVRLGYVKIYGEPVATGAPDVSPGIVDQVHKLDGDPVGGPAPVVSVGTMGSATGGGDPLLNPGEVLGAELLPESWGRYDSAAGSTLIGETPTGIEIYYNVPGKNQQAWKTLAGIDAGDYVLAFDLASDTGSGARSQIMLHRDPFTNLGFDQVFEPGSYRVRVNLKSAVATVRVRFAFDGLFEVPTLYKIDGVSLRKVGS